MRLKSGIIDYLAEVDRLLRSFFSFAPADRIFVTVPVGSSDNIAFLKSSLDARIALALTPAYACEIGMPELHPFTPSSATVWVRPTDGFAEDVIDNLKNGFRFQRDDGAKLLRKHNKVSGLWVRETVTPHSVPYHL